MGFGLAVHSPALAGGLRPVAETGRMPDAGCPHAPCSDVGDWAYAEYDAGRSPEPYLSDLLPRVDGEWNLPEQIPSKFHKLIGMRAMDGEQWAVALKHLERATELYPKAGCSTRIEKCRRALSRQEAAAGGTE